MNKQVKNVVKSLDRKQLRSNCQRVLYTFLTSDQEWVSLDSFRVPNAASRIRDLRSEAGFKVECSRGSQLNRTGKMAAKTFYRLAENSITSSRVNRVFEGVMPTSK